MLGRTNQIEVFTLDLVHHVLHLGEAHHARHHVTVDHVRRDAVGEAAVDHEITAIGQNRGVQASNIAHEVIEAVAGGPAGAVKVDAVQALHDIHMIRNLEIRHDGLAEALDFHVLAVILANRHRRVNDVRNDEHPLADFRLQFVFLRRQPLQIRLVNGDLFLRLFGLFLLTLAHQHANLLGRNLNLVAQGVRLLNRGAVLLVHLDDFVDHDELFVLKLLANVLLHQFGIGTEQIDVQHRKKSSFFAWRKPKRLPIP